MFEEFRNLVGTKVEQMMSSHATLYVVDIPKEKLWDHYLQSFPPGTNPMFRQRTEHDCSTCRSFIRRMGRVVAIEDGKLVSIWDVMRAGLTYQPVADSMAELVKSAKIAAPFFSKERNIGHAENLEDVEKGRIRWTHYHAKVAPMFVTGSVGASVGEFIGRHTVLKGSLRKISGEAVEEVLELIEEERLYKGTEWLGALTAFLALRKNWVELGGAAKELFEWDAAASVAGSAIAHMKNLSIGTLLVDVTEGVVMEEAVRKYENIVAPSNYKRPKEIFTKATLEKAKLKLDELGLSKSYGRMSATTYSVPVAGVFYSDTKYTSPELDVFEELGKDVQISDKMIRNATPIKIIKFLCLPELRSGGLEILVEPRLTKNFVSLVGPSDPDAKPITKWDNNITWAYVGNLADSGIKDAVRDAGGKVDGVLRFSLSWNENGDCNDDLDAHCIEPCGNVIYYSNSTNRNTTGVLDIDITNPETQCKGGQAVENITWSDESKMLEGKYEFKVHNFEKKGGLSGFNAELEYGGEVLHYSWPSPLTNREKVSVVTLRFTPHKGIEVLSSIAGGASSSVEICGLKTRTFRRVTRGMMSPNYWGGQRFGSRHYMFMLEGCKIDERLNGFFNEFLPTELLEHKRVFAALGSKMKVTPSDDQLSGVGFNETVRNHFICRLKSGKIMKVEV